MLGLITYQNAQGILRHVSFTEVLFNKKYINFIDNVSGGTFVLGVDDSEKKHALREHVYFNLLSVLATNNPFDLRTMQYSMGDTLILKELEATKTKPLPTQLNSLMREVTQVDNDCPMYICLQDSGIFNIKSVLETAEGVLIEGRNALVTLRVTVPDGYAPYTKDIVHFIAYYLTVAVANARTKDIISVDYLVKLVHERYGVVIAINSTKQRIK